jgi:hypothetical protein
MERIGIAVRCSALLAIGRHMGTGAMATTEHHDSNQQDQDDDDDPKYLRWLGATFTFRPSARTPGTTNALIPAYQ